MPDLPKGSDNSLFGGDLTHFDPASEQHDSKPHNRSTTSPLVIDRETQSTSPRRLALACESKNTSKNKKGCNTIADVRLISRVGVSQTDGGGETVLDRII